MQMWVGPAIVAAVITVIFGAFRDGYFDGKRRRERMKDIQIALLAEIRAYVAGLRRDDLDEFEPFMVNRMESDESFVPFILREKNDSVFQAILPDIHILPESSIDPVVVYYSQVVAIAEMAIDMRSKVFAELDKERRIEVYRNFIAMKKLAIILGEEAECMLKLYITSGEEGVKTFLNKRDEDEAKTNKAEVKAWLNSQALGPSGPR